jgi:hypothetical protein
MKVPSSVRYAQPKRPGAETKSTPVRDTGECRRITGIDRLRIAESPSSSFQEIAAIDREGNRGQRLQCLRVALEMSVRLECAKVTSSLKGGCELVWGVLV